MARAYSAIGRDLTQGGDLSAALAAERKAIAIYQELGAAEPANTETRANLLGSLEAVGEILGKTGDAEGALENYQKALAVLEAWSKAEPESVLIQRLLAIEETNIAGTYKQMAVSATSPTNEPRAHWRSAQKCYQSSLDAWRRVRAHGRLNKTDEMKMVELTNDLAQCSVALAQR